MNSKFDRIKSVADLLCANKRLTALILAIAGMFWLYACPEKTIVPVDGAQASDWNPEYFWDCPWCTNDVKHKGIDIIKDEGAKVVSATHGMILYVGWLGKYGRVVVVLSPKLRLHMYAHLSKQKLPVVPFVWRGREIGTVGSTGNSDRPHLHYAIISVLPNFWLWEKGNSGWQKMFFLNPHRILTGQ